jgi:uncharacterized protein (TIGR03067 family)
MRAQWLGILGAVLVAGTDAKGQSAKEELKKLQGTWVLTAIEGGGKKSPQDATSDARIEMVIRGNKFATGQVGAPKAQGFLRVDPTKKPKAMDMSPTDAFNPGETTYEIYELKDDILKRCENADKDSGKPEGRPKDFKTGPDSSGHITYWKRKA